jgi:hypothetical protein
VSPGDASPTAPPPKVEASTHRGTRAPVCPAQRDVTGSWTHNRGHGTDPLPKLANLARVNPKEGSGMCGAPPGKFVKNILFFIIRPSTTCTPTAELTPQCAVNKPQTPLPDLTKCVPRLRNQPRRPVPPNKTPSRQHDYTRHPRRPTRPALWTTALTWNGRW